MIGNVRFFDDAKGWGFIESNELDGDIFVHFSKIVDTGKGRRTLKDGETVSFDLVEGPRGWAADNVRRIQSS